MHGDSPRKDDRRTLRCAAKLGYGCAQRARGRANHLQRIDAHLRERPRDKWNLDGVNRWRSKLECTMTTHCTPNPREVRIVLRDSNLRIDVHIELDRARATASPQALSDRQPVRRAVQTKICAMAGPSAVSRSRRETSAYRVVMDVRDEASFVVRANDPRRRTGREHRPESLVALIHPVRERSVDSKHP